MSLGRRRPSRPPVFWRSRGSGDWTLVLINGFSTWAAAWPAAWIERLAAELRVIMLDNRGSGYSRHVELPFSIADMADDVVEVLNEAEVEQAVVMGHSMGGMIAQQLALDAPERVAGLALVGTRPPAPRFTSPAVSVLTLLTRPLLPGESLRSYMRGLWEQGTTPAFVEAHPEAIEELVERTVERPTPRPMLHQQLRAMGGWAHAERLEMLDVPTVVVHGEEDRFTPLANGIALAELIPGARLVPLPGVGHMVPLEAPETLSEELMALATKALPESAGA